MWVSFTDADYVGISGDPNKNILNLQGYDYQSKGKIATIMIQVDSYFYFVEIIQLLH
jgi:hypothetical protein